MFRKGIFFFHNPLGMTENDFHFLLCIYSERDKEVDCCDPGVALYGPAQETGLWEAGRAVIHILNVHFLIYDTFCEKIRDLTD